METIKELRIPRWKQGYPKKEFFPFTLADIGGVWCASCLRYIDPRAPIGSGGESIREWQLNKHHPFQSSWAKNKLPALQPQKNPMRRIPISDFYGVPVHRRCHEKFEDRQAQALGYYLDRDVLRHPSTQIALDLLHNGHIWASFAACWQIVHAVKPTDPNVDAEAKDILLQAGSAIFGPWKPNEVLFTPRPGADPGWRAALLFRAAIHFAAHGIRHTAKEFLELGVDQLPSRSGSSWEDILHYKARAEVLGDLDAAHIVATQTPSISRRQFEAALRLRFGLPANHLFEGLDESLANTGFSFWNYRARQEHFHGLLDLNRRDYKSAYRCLVRAQYIYCRLGLQFPMHAPLLQDPTSYAPGFTILGISFFNNYEANRQRLFNLRKIAIEERGLMAALNREFDIR